jgi:AraC-like DNA-binding protein
MYEFPVKIIQRGVSECSTAWTTDRDYVVPFFRIYYVVEGHGTVAINGVNFPLETGNIYFISGVTPFRNYCEKYMKVFWLHAIAMSPELDTIISNITRVHAWQISGLSEFEATLREIKEISLWDADWRWFELQALVTFVVGRLMKDHQKNGVKPELSSGIRRALKFMDHNFQNNPTLADMAKKASYAPNYFHRVFKALSGMTPHEYIEKKRMVMARMLLTTTDKKLDEISQACGYENSFYFSRVFKKHYGIAPGASRRIDLFP